MKRFLVGLVAMTMVMGLFGMAFADNTASLSDSTTTLRVSLGPVAAQDVGGAGTTVYVVTGNGMWTDDAAVQKGVTVYAIDTVRTDATGLMVKKNLTSPQKSSDNNNPLSGMTPISIAAFGGTNNAQSGTTIFLMAAAQQTKQVGNFASNNRDSLNTGVSLYAINGTSGATIWERGIALNEMQIQPVGGTSGTSFFFVSPITMDTESAASSGITLYGTAGMSPTQASDLFGSGASVFAIDADSGALAVQGGQTAVTEFGRAPNGSGVSGFYAAPVISGESVYTIGWNGTTGGVTIYEFQKNNIRAGVSHAQTVIKTGVGFSQMQIPTPAVSGNSIFVVAWGAGGFAGVTAYEIQKLVPQASVTFPIAAGTGVSASPVTDGSFLVVGSTSAVTCFALTSTGGFGANTAKWMIDLTKAPYTDATYRIFGTPSISNGYVWIPVTDTAGANKGFVLRAELNSTTGSASKVGGITEMVIASPIISWDHAYAVTYNPTITQITNSGARGEANWAQFKADKAKTGSNTRAAASSTPGDDDDSGCFISTIK